jgi:hypothetical protein
MTEKILKEILSELKETNKILDKLRPFIIAQVQIQKQQSTIAEKILIKIKDMEEKWQQLAE